MLYNSCPYHKGKDQKLICVTCKEYLCIQCQLLHKRTHNIKPIQSILQQYYSELSKMNSNYINILKQQIQSKLDLSFQYLQNLIENPLTQDFKKNDIGFINQLFDFSNETAQSEFITFLNKIYMDNEIGFKTTNIIAQIERLAQQIQLLETDIQKIVQQNQLNQQNMDQDFGKAIKKIKLVIHEQKQPKTKCEITQVGNSMKISQTPILQVDWMSPNKIIFLGSDKTLYSFNLNTDQKYSVVDQCVEYFQVLSQIQCLVSYNSDKIFVYKYSDDKFGQQFQMDASYEHFIFTLQNQIIYIQELELFWRDKFNQETNLILKNDQELNDLLYDPSNQNIIQVFPKGFEIISDQAKKKCCSYFFQEDINYFQIDQDLIYCSVGKIHINIYQKNKLKVKLSINHVSYAYLKQFDVFAICQYSYDEISENKVVIHNGTDIIGKLHNQGPIIPLQQGDNIFILDDMGWFYKYKLNF
ncbi:hypothetical protein pb186bvf_011974 [Paramecium bursaria]